jgi:hypothetical protein
MSFIMVIPERPRSLGSEQYRGYQARLREKARAGFTGRAPLRGDLYMRILWLHTQPTTLDIDNIAKRILDALKGIVYDDDNTIVMCLLQRLRYTMTVEIVSRPDTPSEVIDELNGLMEQRRRDILCIEVGQVRERQIVFGPVQ